MITTNEDIIEDAGFTKLIKFLPKDNLTLKIVTKKIASLNGIPNLTYADERFTLAKYIHKLVKTDTLNFEEIVAYFTEDENLANFPNESPLIKIISSIYDYFFDKEVTSSSSSGISNILYRRQNTIMSNMKSKVNDLLQAIQCTEWK